MVLLTRVFQSALPAARSPAPTSGGDPVPALMRAGRIRDAPGDPLGALADALAYASEVGAADRMTLLADGATLRLLVSHPRDLPTGRSLARLPATLPGTLPDRLLAGVLAAYGVPYDVLHVDLLPECNTLVIAVRMGRQPDARPGPVPGAEPGLTRT